MSTAPERVVITGASGHLGRAVTREVLRRVPDHGTVILTSRTPERLIAGADGAEVRYADFDDEKSLRHAFAGASRLLLISTDRVETRARQHAAAIDAAVASGVRHVIYTSMIEPGPANPALISPSHDETEQYVRASGLDWTLLRCALYADFLVFDAQAAARTGRLVHNFGAGRCAYVARADCAAAAAAAITGRARAGRIYELTGPHAWSAAELASLYQRWSGRPVVATGVSDDELAAVLVGDDPDGHTRYGVALAVSLGQATRSGLFARCGTGVADLTGDEPISVPSVLSAAPRPARGRMSP